MHYIVTLRESGLSAAERAAAQAAYCRTLERSLGGEDEVLSCYRVFDAVCEACGTQSRKEEEIAKRWQTACVRARQEGLRGIELPEDTEAYFDFRLEH